MAHQRTIPREIPGQTLGIDVKAKEGYITEPIHDLPAIKNQLAGKFELPPERESFPDINPDEWLFWLKGTVDTGVATVVNGKLPDAVNFTPKQFGEVENKRDKMIDALVAVLYSQLDANAKKQVSELVGV